MNAFASVLTGLVLLLLPRLSWAQTAPDSVLASMRAEVEQHTQTWISGPADAAAWEAEHAWLEGVLLKLGHEVDIVPGEFDLYFMGVMFATVPDSVLAEILMQSGVHTRSELLSKWLRENANLSPIPFDAAVWRSPRVAYDAGRPRYRMWKGLQKVQPLEGQSEADVEALLGPPERREPGGAWMYLLGSGLGIGPDLLYLRLTFESGRVARSAGVTEH